MVEGARSAAAPPRSLAAAVQLWVDPPDNILVRISAFLSCRADRVHLACVNRHWHAAVTGLRRPPPPLLPPLPPLPPQLPWLIFPSTTPATFYSVLGDNYHGIYRQPFDVRAARCRGSGDGGWLVLEFDAPHVYALYNLNSGERVPLPPGFRSPSSSDNNAEFPLVLENATLSASPSNGPAYMVAATALVDDRPTAAFWSPGHESWFSTRDLLSTVLPYDVIYHGGAFFFIMDDEELVMFRTAYGPNGNMTLQGRAVCLGMRQREDYVADVGLMSTVGEMDLYLVESRGSLHMVVRYVFDGRPGTKKLQVFRLCTSGATVGHQRTWEHIDKLDGRMFFLGTGCSRSFEVARYDGFRESEIYFVDESCTTFLPVVDDDTESEDDAEDDDDVALEGDDDDAGSEDDADPGSVEDDDDAGPVNDVYVTLFDNDGPDDLDGNDDEAGTVYDKKPDNGRFSLATGKAEPWPRDGPRSDVRPIWWLH